MPIVVFAAWEVVVKVAVGVFPILADGGKNVGLPIGAAVHAVVHNYAHPTTSVPGAPAGLAAFAACAAPLVILVALYRTQIP